MLPSLLSGGPSNALIELAAIYLMNQKRGGAGVVPEHRTNLQLGLLLPPREVLSCNTFA